MYARKLTFKTKSGVRSEVEALADQVFSFVKSLDGFISIHFIFAEDENEYGSFSLWESREEAESAGETIHLKIREALEKLAIEPPTLKIYEVYKPKS